MRKGISRYCLILMGIMTIWMLLSGFTFEPVKEETAQAYIELQTGGKTENITHIRPDWWPAERTIDGKTGKAASETWQRQALLSVNPAVMGEIHRVKVTVEWYDAPEYAESGAEKFMSLVYPNLEGTSTTKYIVSAPAGTGSWQETTVELTDLDVSKLGILYGAYPDVNFNVRTDILSTTLGTESTEDDYYGILIHSVSITPLDSTTYDLHVLDNVPAAVYSADGVNSDIGWVTASGIKGDTQTRTVTDANGVTHTGKITSEGTGANNQDKECYFMLDTEKDKDVRKVNVEVTWFDGQDSDNNNAAKFNIRWTRKEGPGKWGMVDEKEAGWTKGDGLWKTTLFTLEDCDFSDPTVASKWIPNNLSFYTGNNLCDMNTPEDPSDDYYGILIAKVVVTPIAEYTFTALRFTDENNQELSALNAGGSFYTDLTVTRNGGEEAADVSVLVVLYNEADGRVEQISCQTKSMEPNATAEFNNCFTNPEDVSGRYVKVMVWDSLTGMVPISNELICR